MIEVRRLKMSLIGNHIDYDNPHRNTYINETVRWMAERDGLTLTPRAWWLDSSELGTSPDGDPMTTWVVAVEVVS